MRAILLRSVTAAASAYESSPSPLVSKALTHISFITSSSKTILSGMSSSVIGTVTAGIVKIEDLLISFVA